MHTIGDDCCLTAVQMCSPGHHIQSRICSAQVKDMRRDIVPGDVECANGRLCSCYNRLSVLGVQHILGLALGVWLLYRRHLLSQWVASLGFWFHREVVEHQIAW